MSFNPRAVAAMKLKEAKMGGKVPANPMNPQNVLNQVPNLVPSNPMPMNPVASATMSQFKPKIPGLPPTHIPGSSVNPDAMRSMRLFGNLRKKLGGV